MKESRSRSPVPWFGGKQRLAEQIVSLFPPHDSYVEVFGGGGSVLFSKAPATLEIYNDLDEGLVTFFRALRDKPEELVPLLELTPYARAEWQFCRETWRDPDLTDVEKARRWYVCASQSFGGMVARGREGWAAGARSVAHAPELRDLTNVGGPSGWKSDRHPNGERHHGRGWGGEKLGRVHLSRAASTANRIDGIWRFVERLRTVQIENLEWRDAIDRYDHPSALFYLDPPYVPTTRRAGGYDHELTEEDHAELVDIVLGIQGIAIVSGYETPLARALADRHYNRQAIGAAQFVPPGACVVLRTPEGGAAWITSWPQAEYVQHAWAGAWVNSLFRNERQDLYLSSDLIRQAVAVTLSEWPDPPELGMVTFVDASKTRHKRDPGRCYRRAGFQHVGFTQGGLHAFQLLPDDMPEPLEPIGKQMEIVA